jgi:hypothetical protein
VTPSPLAVLAHLPPTALNLICAVADLASAEGVGLTLTLALTLRIADPLALQRDILAGQPDLTPADLAQRLAALLGHGLASRFRSRSLAHLAGDANLRVWLEEGVWAVLQGADLAGRSGLAVEQAAATALTCRGRGQGAGAETVYHVAGLGQNPGPGAALLTPAILAAWGLASPSATPQPAQTADPSGLAAHVHSLRNPPSLLRPEIWRRHLPIAGPATPVLAAAPGGERLYVAARSGAVYALDAASGESIWPAPVVLPTELGDGLTLAQGALWLPGHDGFLYQLDSASGHLLHRVEIGGRLSSPPLAVGDRLYQSVDVAADRLGAEGQVVVVDARSGRLLHHWQASSRAIRAQPTLLGHHLFVGDRQSSVAIIDLRRDGVQTVALRGGRILAPGLADPQRGQVIFGSLYGLVAALDTSGVVRWQYRLPAQIDAGQNASRNAAVVGQPCLHGDWLFVGAGDGRLYALHPATGQPVQPPFVAGGPIAADPVVWRDLLFVSARDGYLYALHAATLQKFWAYPSGSPISTAPALAADGRLFALDEAGHLNALRWCLARYSEAAHMAEERPTPDWQEACELWMLAQDAQAALAAAEKAGRLDLIAALAGEMGWHKRAAQAHESLAGRARTAPDKARHWRAAAGLWALAQEEEAVRRCRGQAALALNAPLLALSSANLPSLVQGQRAFLQVTIRNVQPALAQGVILHFSGHVAQAGRVDVGTIGPSDEEVRQVEVTPSASGSALVRLHVAYTDARGNHQDQEELTVRLAVAQPPKVEYHYHGPTVAGDGVIIQRSDGRLLLVGEDGVQIERPASSPACPRCGAALAPDGRHCDRCGATR